MGRRQRSARLYLSSYIKALLRSIMMHMFRRAYLVTSVLTFLSFFLLGGELSLSCVCNNNHGKIGRRIAEERRNVEDGDKHVRGPSVS